MQALRGEARALRGDARALRGEARALEAMQALRGEARALRGEGRLERQSKSLKGRCKTSRGDSRPWGASQRGRGRMRGEARVWRRLELLSSKPYESSSRFRQAFTRKHSIEDQVFITWKHWGPNELTFYDQLDL